MLRSLDTGRLLPDDAKFSATSITNRNSAGMRYERVTPLYNDERFVIMLPPMKQIANGNKVVLQFDREPTREQRMFIDSIRDIEDDLSTVIRGMSSVIRQDPGNPDRPRFIVATVDPFLGDLGGKAITLEIFELHGKWAPKVYIL